jgi:transketolase
MNYINKGDKATKEGFSEALITLGNKYEDIVLLGADITSSVGMDGFLKKFPNRFFSMGIAEQNCIGVSAGLALSGKTPIFSTYGVFAALRTTDQIRISLCYNNLHAIIGGAHSGISVGPDGATHQALEDIAVLRSLPNITILSPADSTQSYMATMASYEDCKGPVYVRFGRASVPDFTSQDLKFEVGKSQLMIEGIDISIIATGHMVWEAINASWELMKKGISARVINMHTIKPIDKPAIIKAAQETKAIITAEEHQIIGGLGSAVAEVVVQNHPVPMRMIGMNDRFGESGNPNELMEKYGLTSKSIVASALSLK